MKEYSRQQSKVRITKSVYCLLFTVCCLLSTAVMAVSWDPEEVLRQYLADNYPWARIEISGVKILGAIPDKAPNLIIVEKGPIGNGVFAFVFDDNRKVVIKADVRAFDNVVKSKRPFKKGYVLGNEDIYLSEMDINKMPKSSVQDPEEIIGKPLRISVMANITLTENVVEKSQVVDKGKQVVLLFNARGFNISAAGETREKGYVGTAVKAINVSSKKEVRGVLIDERTVKVEL